MAASLRAADSKRTEKTIDSSTTKRRTDRVSARTRSHGVKSAARRAKPAHAGDALFDSFVGYNLRRAAAKQRERFRSVLGPYDIRPSQLTMLIMIQENSSLRQSALAEALDIKRANVVTLLDELEDRGLVQRRRSKHDRRSHELHLTARGDELTTNLRALHAKLEDDLARNLGSEKLATLVELLRQFRTLESEPDLG